MQGLFSQSRERMEILLRKSFAKILPILGGFHFGANTCRACIRKTHANYWFRKVWVSIKFTPPPRGKGPKWGKTIQISRKSSKLTVFLAGGGNAIVWTKRFYGHLGVSDWCILFHVVLGRRGKSGKCKALIFLRVWSFYSHALFILSADDLADFSGIL